METHHMGHMTSGEILRNSLMKLIFEGLGTMFLTITFNATAQPAKSTFASQQVALLITMWVMVIFGMNISGAHYNPAVSLAYMLRKDVGRFPRILGLAYMISQIVGAYVGSLISWFLLVPTSGDAATGLIAVNEFPPWSQSSAIFAGIIGEAIGTFITVFFYLTQTEQKTTFSKEKAINCFIIAAAYIAGRSMVQGQTSVLFNGASLPGGYAYCGAVLNPAIAIGTTLTMLVNNASVCTNIWLFALIPLGGAVLAVLFHEFVFKKTHEALEASDYKDEGDDNLLQ